MNEIPSTEWGLVNSAYTNNGELDGMDNNTCFILGAEWEKFCNSIRNVSAFSVHIQKENADRLIQIASDHNRSAETKPYGEYVLMNIGEAEA